jgi:hypothetical protein
MKLIHLNYRSHERIITVILGFFIAVGGCQLSQPVFGVYQGGDMSYPWTSSDAWHQFASMLNPWATFSLASGYYSADNSSWFLPLVRAIGIQATQSPELIQRCEILFIVTLAGLSMYFLVQSFHLNRFSAIITALFYSFSPVMFNYTVMGWTNLTLTYASIPLVILLLRSLNESKQENLLRKFSLGILAGILFTGSAALASLLLTIVLSWRPARHKITESLRTKAQGTFTFVSGFLFINAFWIVPRLIYSPLNDASGLKSIASSLISRGARAFFSFSSLLTSEYSQYNNSFFVAFPNMLKSLLVGLPVIAVLGIFTKQKGIERHLITRLILLWIVFAFLALSDWIYRIGPLGLVFGRDTTRLYNFGFFCMALMAAFYISSSPRDQPAQTYTKQFLIVLILIVQVSPFLLGKLESSVLPAQPALTLRPAVISGEYSQIYNMIKENSGHDSSVLVVPGSPNYRMADERNRFEPLFNTVSGVGMHLPLPATWWATDKIPPALKDLIDGRAAQLISGNFSELSNLMVRENSTMVLVDQVGTTPDDLIVIDTVLNSGKFLELTQESPEGINSRRFRLFKSLVTTAADRQSYTPINFLNSSQNPIGSRTNFCRPRTVASATDSIQFRTPFTFAKNWSVSVQAVSTKGKCTSDSPNLTKLSSQSTSVDGLLNISVIPGGSDDFFTVTAFFRPARLQEQLIILTVSLLILLCFVAIANYQWRKRKRFGDLTSA